MIRDYRNYKPENNPVIRTSIKSSGNSKSSLSFLTTPNYSKKQKKKKNTDPNLTRDFCSTAFLSKPYGYSFFIRAFLYGCGRALGKLKSITISLIAGPFDDIFPWPFKGTIQISVFRQDNFGLIWTNL